MRYGNYQGIGIAGTPKYQQELSPLFPDLGHATAMPVRHNAQQMAASLLQLLGST